VPKLWRPLRARLAGKPVITLVSTVPSDPLERKLREWLEEVLSSEDEEIIHRLAVRLDNAEAMDDREQLYEYASWDELYENIDAVLALCLCDQDSLQELLDDGLSAYTIAPGGGGLETRADPTAAAAFSESIKTAEARNDAGSAAGHLATAWKTTYALKPDAVRAYSESIKAVEAAAHSVIEPGNGKATLGTMLRQMKDHPGDYCVMLPAPNGAAAVISMMAVLWQGQTSRHGGQTPTRPETVEEARAGVQLAVALVHWFSTGVVKRK